MASKPRPTTSDRAFLLRIVPHGEGGAIVTALTEAAGLLALVSRHTGSRGVLLEPFHTLQLEYARGSGELFRLRSAAIDTARTRLWTNRATLEVAGTLCRWIRGHAPPQEPAPELFGDLERALDHLEQSTTLERQISVSARAQVVLTAFGLMLLERAGLGLHPAQCARCGRPRPARKRAWVEERDGVVCERCLAAAELRTTERHGAVLLLSGALLDHLEQPWSLLDYTDSALALDGLDTWVQRAVALHTQVRPTPSHEGGHELDPQRDPQRDPQLVPQRDPQRDSQLDQSLRRGRPR